MTWSRICFTVTCSVMSIDMSMKLLLTISWFSPTLLVLCTFANNNTEYFGCSVLLAALLQSKYLLILIIWYKLSFNKHFVDWYDVHWIISSFYVSTNRCLLIDFFIGVNPSHNYWIAGFHVFRTVLCETVRERSRQSTPPSRTGLCWLQHHQLWCPINSCCEW